MRLMKFAAALAAGVATAFMAAASGEELGPPTGAIIPHDLTANDSTGAPRAFDSLVGENGMALFFVRSVDWCPYCQAQTIAVDKEKAAFDERGLSVVFVSYDSPEKQTAFIQKNSIAATLLSDPNSEIIDAFGLRNETHAPGSRFAGIPHPAVFIVTPDKTIKAKLYEEDFATNDKSYRNRPAAEAVLAAADAALAHAGGQ